MTTPHSKSALPPVLITDGTWWGSLAAARDLGAQGVPVTLATNTRLAPGRWSRFVSTMIASSPKGDPATLLDWLTAFGKEHPGHVLYPTSDDFAWLICANARQLSEHFQLSVPPLDALIQLLDKARLGEQARAAGLPTPATAVPQNEADVLRCARELGYPLFIKPRVGLFGAGSSKAKGTRVASEERLLEEWHRLRGNCAYHAQVLAQIPDVALPVLQASTRSTERVYTINGYYNRELDQYVSVACTKILQLPRGKGPGIIFEHSALEPELDAGLHRMFRNCDFSGVFDAEFLEADGKRQLIDLNPRFYNHMSFEIERGMRLPWFAYLQSRGMLDELSVELSRYALGPRAPRSYVQKLPTRLLLLTQRLSGRMSAEECRKWRSYLNSRDELVTDPVSPIDDPKPWIGEFFALLRGFLRHPRAFLRSFLYSPH